MSPFETVLPHNDHQERFFVFGQAHLLVEPGLQASNSPEGADPAVALPAVLHVERVAMSAMIGHQISWQDLCERALEANIFLEPAFALPLLQHALAPDRPEFLLVWEEDGPVSFGRLVGLLCFRPPSRLTPRVLRGFADSCVKLGTPLLDRERAADVLDAMLQWLAGAEPNAVALRLSGLDADGPFMSLLARRSEATGCEVAAFGEHRRAILTRADNGTAKVTPLIASRRRKEWRRQRRRLTERGERTYISASTPETIARAVEHFLALEHNGWKGKQGTALLANPGFATFTRSMTRMMAHEGKCRIDSIEIDGTPVAMGIILTSAGRAHFWKTAFNETHRALSPGVQFTLELTDVQLGEAAVNLTDSCAVPDHPMIDRLWADRLRVSDVLVALSPADRRHFASACRRETAARTVRAWIKRAYLRLRRG